MTLKITADDAIAACNAIVDRLDLGAGAAATLVVYSGPEPGNIADALDPSSLELVTLTMSATAFGNAADVSGQAYVEAVANPVADVPAAADGVATFFRVFDKDDNIRWQGSVSEPNGGGELEISSVNVIQNVNVVTIALRARMPKGGVYTPPI